MQFDGLKRRAFITLLGGTAAWPLVGRAQSPASPVIGFLSSASPQNSAHLGSFRRGLQEMGYVEGQNVGIDYRWAEGQNNRLPELAADLVRRRVTVIAAEGTPSTLAAKAATSTIPIVFAVAVNPVEVGLVTSLSRPGGHLTGVTNLNEEVGPKRVELVHELLPAMTSVAVLVNPTNRILAEAFAHDVQSAAGTLGLKLHVLRAGSERELEGIFASLAQLKAGALIICPDVFFNERVEQLAALTLRHAVPTVYQYRPFAVAGGLLSYGSDETEYFRLVGAYTGRILKGEKPADLPVQRATKVELIVNLKTARALGITVPLPLLGRADEVIE
jgi:putative tryptophan/tyrosine transport system substrate-binding protein